MKIIKTKFDKTFIIKLDTKSDIRGNFTRLFCEKIFSTFGINFQIKQSSFATNIAKHTLRGLHYQDHPRQEQKLIFCLKGKIWDVIVDVRKDSKTFGKWQCFELNNKNCLFVPKGFAHGYITLTKIVHLVYYMDEFYDDDLTKGVIWNDKKIGIKWPYEPKLISKKDKTLPTLNFL